MTPLQRFSGKVCLVIGAATGIGAALVVRLLEEGAKVAAAGWPHPTGVSHAQLITLDCDVAQEEQVQQCVAAVLQHWQHIDVLVNCAGIVRNDNVADMLDAQWQALHDINLMGSMRSMRAVLPHMLARGTGSIVNIASVAAFNASAGMASYAASKAGLVSLTRSAAQSYGPQGVRVNAVCPGWVDTPMSQQEMRDLAKTQGVSLEQARQQTVARVALGRMAEPSEIAAVCAFLGSDDASFVTGAALVVDGGSRIPAAVRAV